MTLALETPAHYNKQYKMCMLFSLACGISQLQFELLGYMKSFKRDWPSLSFLIDGLIIYFLHTPAARLWISQ